MRTGTSPRRTCTTPSATGRAQAAPSPFLYFRSKCTTPAGKWLRRGERTDQRIRQMKDGSGHREPRRSSAHGRGGRGGLFDQKILEDQSVHLALAKSTESIGRR